MKKNIIFSSYVWQLVLVQDVPLLREAPPPQCLTAEEAGIDGRILADQFVSVASHVPLTHVLRAATVILQSTRWHCVTFVFPQLLTLSRLEAE